MKLQGRRQSGNVQDRRKTKDKLSFRGSDIQRAAHERVHQEAIQRKPKSLGTVTDRMIQGMDNLHIQNTADSLRRAIMKRKK